VVGLVGPKVSPVRFVTPVGSPTNLTGPAGGATFVLFFPISCNVLLAIHRNALLASFRNVLCRTKIVHHNPLINPVRHINLAGLVSAKETRRCAFHNTGSTALETELSGIIRKLTWNYCPSFEPHYSTISEHW
jgi:hypothetical protein